MDIIKDLFNERDQRCIVNTTIGDTGDILYWGWEATDQYSLRSAYRVLQAQKLLWREEDTRSLWHQICIIKAPPKTLNLIWRALSNCLPTYRTLVNKFVPVSAICPVCQGGDETIYHTLLNCCFAAQCWNRK